MRRVSTHEEHEEWRVAGFPQYNCRENEWGVSEACEERRVADSLQYNRREMNGVEYCVR